MATDRKKKKEKEKERPKDKKKDRGEKKKHRKSRHSSDDSDDSDSDSDSSVEVSKHRKKDRVKKKIKKEKEKRKSVSEKETPAAANNNPYNFDTVAVIPSVIKGSNLPFIPPPLPNAPTTASVPKPKIKEPNIFKLLPKLHYGAVQLAKTIYSSEYLSEDVLDTVMMEMAKSIEQTTKEEQHKKGSSSIAKCIVELEKIMGEEK
jgi:hypothetical protein